jgi:hypothetical protein
MPLPLLSGDNVEEKDHVLLVKGVRLSLFVTLLQEH